MSRFWGFRSLWRTWWWWMYARPRKSWNMKSWKEWTLYLSRFGPLWVDFASKSETAIWKNIVQVSLEGQKKWRFYIQRGKKDKESQVSRPCPKSRDSGFSLPLISLILKELSFLKNLKGDFEVFLWNTSYWFRCERFNFSFPSMNLAYKIKVDLEMIF